MATTLVYEEFEPRRGAPVRGLDPLKQFAKHANNWFYLHALTTHRDWSTRRQAAVELIICERKMEYWRRHPAVTVRYEIDVIAVMRTRWKSEAAPKDARLSL